MSSPSSREPDESALSEQLDALATRYGDRFLLEAAPDNRAAASTA